MNKSIIKNTTTNTREKLIEGILERLISLNIIRETSGNFKVLIRKIGNIDIREEDLNSTIEDIAYMWFIRLVAIRFMEVNGYIHSNIKSNIFNKTDFIKLCNYLAELMPNVFEKIEEEVFWLLPIHMFGEKSIVADFIGDIEDHYWEVEGVEGYGIEIVGWLYQYFFSVRKEKIFLELKKKKLSKKDLPTATQIFTPKWIVKYMVENSLGKLWLESSPNKTLEDQWQYILGGDTEEKEPKTPLQGLKNNLINPEEIRFLDPAMGSGNILLYAFDVLYEIYGHLGYPPEEIPKLILEKNLYGLDIDDRVTRVAIFSLLMKGSSKNNRILDAGLKLNLIAIQESHGISKEILECFCENQEDILEAEKFRGAMAYLIEAFKDAKEYGALINIKSMDFNFLEKKIEEFQNTNSSDLPDLRYKERILERMLALIQQGKILNQKYDVVVANPPYSGLRRFNSKLKAFVEKYYKDYKYDLFSLFIVRNMDFIKDHGIAGFMTPNVWQYISSYENLRNNIIDNYQLLSLIQLDDNEFEDASVSISAFVIRKSKAYRKTLFIKLDKLTREERDKSKSLILKYSKHRFLVDQRIFKKVPSSKIAFWIKDNTIKTFEKGKRLSEVGMPRQGLATSDNSRFLRYWYEVDINKIYFPNAGFDASNYKWIPYNKGGGYRKWYGNHYFVINWENNGYAIKKYAEELYGNYSRTIKNEEFYFMEGITYNFIGRNISPRFSPKGFIFDVAGSMIFVEKDKLYYILSLLASKLSNHYMEFLNPSLNIQVGDIKNIPIIEPMNKNTYMEILHLADENIKISKYDWDSYETSWDFKIHPILNRQFKAKTIKESYENWAAFREKQFNTLKENEEKLNRIFINIYDIEEELTPEVSEENITIRRAKEERDIKSFISYGVGCMFGRYSLDEEGIIYAGGNFQNKFKFKDGLWRIRTKDGWRKSSMSIAEDNMIPITKGELDKNHIVNQFIEFIKVTFGEETLGENLSYIASILYREDNLSPIEKIRQYFLKDFFFDHMKIYQNRPIYWLIDGNEKDDSKSLIYIHRHKELPIDKIKNMDLDYGIRKNYEKYFSVSYE